MPNLNLNQADQTLDLRQTRCPLNFVKTRLALEKRQPGDVLAVCLDTTRDDNALQNVTTSVTQEGHCVIGTLQGPDTGSQWVLIRVKHATGTKRS
ncbi:MAG: sulfurtransferase TusA family protein [Vampirovibrionales bacterium]|nr:sulfurtransferase TusA family protein [Vampirovibrionales bacterium]